ncbi:hypothetical protein CYMTET_40147 [Cymbomonas tetramitiformis]|uniref:Uncharacterized protein n=1 Tax=Cymbomonas tetramitiformis TaxID=36881 RepID=A0AAE0CAG0_9CHLO|nr:hypothetical protein CYMTET_40149 [Cymbomonas tetramitiformis]KAK3250475.1 hypothetical protein CYMTET_40147 [Cymbomonas tetramitiformis]
MSTPSTKPPQSTLPDAEDAACVPQHVTLYVVFFHIAHIPDFKAGIVCIREASRALGVGVRLYYRPDSGDAPQSIRAASSSSDTAVQEGNGSERPPTAGNAPVPAAREVYILAEGLPSEMDQFVNLLKSKQRTSQQEDVFDHLQVLGRSWSFVIQEGIEGVEAQEEPSATSKRKRDVSSGQLTQQRALGEADVKGAVYTDTEDLINKRLCKLQIDMQWRDMVLAARLGRVGCSTPTGTGAAEPLTKRRKQIKLSVAVSSGGGGPRFWLESLLLSELSSRILSA